MNLVFFDDYSSDDWGIVLSSYSVGDAEAKEKYVDIPLGDGVLDLTEALTGEVSYNNRPFEARFTLKQPYGEWEDLLRHIRSCLNGRKRKIRIKKDPGYHLVGRCKTQFETDGVFGYIVVTANCEPYKYKDGLTVHDLTIGGSGSITVTLINSRKRVIPRFTNSDEITIEYGNRTIDANAGSHRFTNVVLVEGNNEMTLSGEPGTTVKIEYQEGAL